MNIDYSSSGTFFFLVAEILLLSYSRLKMFWNISGASSCKSEWIYSWTVAQFYLHGFCVNLHFLHLFIHDVNQSIVFLRAYEQMRIFCNSFLRYKLLRNWDGDDEEYTQLYKIERHLYNCIRHDSQFHNVVVLWINSEVHFNRFHNISLL